MGYPTSDMVLVERSKVKVGVNVKVKVRANSNRHGFELYECLLVLYWFSLQPSVNSFL